MSETGATPEQIEAAAERLYNVIMTGDIDQAHMTGTQTTFEIDVRCHGTGRTVTNAASYLVPPDHRIIDADDIAALRRVLSWVHGLPHTIDPDGQPGRDLATLAALIGDDGE